MSAAKWGGGSSMHKTPSPLQGNMEAKGWAAGTTFFRRVGCARGAYERLRGEHDGRNLERQAENQQGRFLCSHLRECETEALRPSDPLARLATYSSRPRLTLSGRVGRQHCAARRAPPLAWATTAGQQSGAPGCGGKRPCRRRRCRRCAARCLSAEVPHRLGVHITTPHAAPGR
jgi:hypothetical protein